MKIRLFTLDKMDLSSEAKKMSTQKICSKCGHFDRKIFGPLFFQNISGHPIYEPHPYSLHSSACNVNVVKDEQLNLVKCLQ